ncbi:MAG: hypothetical protein ABIG95_06770 [Candidatus Woesearchaeota archaeon]
MNSGPPKQVIASAGVTMPSQPVKRAAFIYRANNLPDIHFFTGAAEKLMHEIHNLERMGVKIEQHPADRINIFDIYQNVYKTPTNFSVTKLPRILYIELSRNCNTWCNMCKGYSQQPEYKPEYNMDLALFKKIAKEVFPHVEEVDLRGFGESTVRDDFKQILTFLAKFTCTFSIITNFAKKDDELWETMLQRNYHLFLSIDASTKELGEYIRKGLDFDILTHNLQLLKTNIQKNPAIAKNICLKMAVQKINMSEIENILLLSSKYLIPTVELLYVEQPGLTIAELPPEQVRKTIDSARTLAAKLDIRLILRSRRFNSNCKIIKNCTKPFDIAYINYKGWIGPCDHQMGLLVLTPYTGNLMQDWNSFNFRLYRKLVNTPFMHAFCRNCTKPESTTTKTG